VRHTFKILIAGFAILLVLSACGEAPATYTPAQLPTQPAPSSTNIPSTPTAELPTTQPPPTDIPAPTATPIPAEDLAALVNGVPIFLEEFEREVARQRAANEHAGIIPADPAGFERAVLNTLIEQELIRQRAAEMGIAISEEQLDAEIAEHIQMLGGAEAWSAWLEENTFTEAEHRKQQFTQMLGGKLVEAVIAEVPRAAEQVHARHILVERPEMAEALLEQILQGADFAELAKEHSLDTTTRDSGGDLGWFTRGQLFEPTIENAAFNLAPGEVSTVIVSQLGYHIVQTLEREMDRPLDENALETLNQLAIERWQQSLWQDADIRRFVE
jgi:parvulin-like peptidyl-prolyl isomerase